MGKGPSCTRTGLGGAGGWTVIQETSNIVSCIPGVNHENHSRAVRRAVPAGKGGGGAARPQVQGPGRGGAAAGAADAARRAFPAEPRGADGASARRGGFG